MGKLTAFDKFVQQALKYGFSLFGTAKTGQTTSYVEGDDGDLQRGYPYAGARFVDNGDGTITDNATGLMWVKEPGAIGGSWGNPGSPFNMDWGDAIDYSAALTYAGHSDWRCPTIKELVSIVDYSRYNLAINPTFFPSTQDSYYWSSTTYHNAATNAMCVVARDGRVDDDGKNEDYYTRPVRLGVPKA